MRIRPSVLLWLVGVVWCALLTVVVGQGLGIPATGGAIAPTPGVAHATTTPPLSVLRLDPARLAQTLDRGNVTDAIVQLENGWKIQFDEYYRDRLTSRVLSVPQMTQTLNRITRLTGTRTALLYAISLPNQLELILLPPQGSPIHRRVTAANRAALAERANQFRAAISRSTSSRTAYLTAGQQMYQWLIAPLQADLERQGIDTLLFCLGGGLRSLPLAALHDGRRFLVEQYNLALIPALNLLDLNPARLEGAQALVMGASEFQQAPPLPAVPLEVAAVNRLWPGESWLNQRFTTEWLKSRRSRYPFGIVHLATHAELAPGSVENSYIQFWDRPLRLDRVGELNLSIPIVQLLVLSACDTALGNPQAELGFAGLAVQTGVKAALASLWNVSDAGTLVLMTDFYQRLKTATIKAEALRQSQLALLRGESNLQRDRILRVLPAPLPAPLQSYRHVEFSHPYYWAAFTLIGNPW